MATATKSHIASTETDAEIIDAVELFGLKENEPVATSQQNARAAEERLFTRKSSGMGIDIIYEEH